MITDLNRSIEEFFVELPNFPGTLSTSTLRYNHERIYQIFQKEELIAFFKEKDLITHANELAQEYNQISKLVLSDQVFNLSLFDDITKRIEETFSGDLYLYTKQWGLSVKALAFYKFKSYEKAIALTHECLALNYYLVDSGLYTLHYRILEQYKNLCRVYFTMKNNEKSFTLFNSVLIYLLTGSAGQLTRNYFSIREHYDVLPYFREGYAYDTLREMVFFLLKNFSVLTRENFYMLFNGLEDIEVNTPERLIIYNWYSISTYFFKKNYDQFFKDCSEFFAEEFSKTFDVLKISIISMISSYLNEYKINDREFKIDKLNEYLFTHFGSKDLNDFKNISIHNLFPKNSSDPTTNLDN